MELYCEAIRIREGLIDSSRFDFLATVINVLLINSILSFETTGEIFIPILMSLISDV